MSFVARLIATWFYCGYFPKGPGTAGSIGALIVAWPLVHYHGWPPLAFAGLAAAALLPAIWAAGRMARDTGLKDPQTVVVDEVVGQWIALAGAPGLDRWSGWVAAFVFFRLFDIYKPPPVRQLEKVPGGAGIVLDDVMAGVYAALVLASSQWFNR
ncbi:MAG: phosphatidylglycerophosphatase A [Acidobacteriota bacterium]